jgi:hypothetical protein
MAAVYFVWRETQRGEARPEIWFGERSADFKPVPTLAKHKLPDDLAWKAEHGQVKIVDLAALYPAPAVPE